MENRIRFFTDTRKTSGKEVEMIAVMLVGMVEEGANHWMKDKKVSRKVCEEYLVRAVSGVLAHLPPRGR
ncbi:MAG: hypothetical protein H5T73_11610 [Actinobacteria bacterium]|nr:hypothetical protein [Actinomycetota bacterium]